MSHWYMVIPGYVFTYQSQWHYQSKNRDHTYNQYSSESGLSILRLRLLIIYTLLYEVEAIQVRVQVFQFYARQE